MDLDKCMMTRIHHEDITEYIFTPLKIHSIRITLGFVRNAPSQASPQTYWIQIDPREILVQIKVCRAQV